MEHFVVVAKVLERGECSLSVWKYSQVFAVIVESRHSQVSEAVSELVATCLLVDVVDSLM